MDLKNKKIIQVASYAAAYKGNFVRSLEYLENCLSLENTKQCYIFQQSTSSQPWYEEFSKSHTSYLVEDNGDYAVQSLLEIFSIEQPDLVHTHHDGHDKAVAKACNLFEQKYGKHIIQVWHLRNVKGLSQHGFHKLWWNLKFFIHYGYYGKRVNMISVNEYMLNFARKFKRMNFWTSDSSQMISLHNGIALSRIDTNDIPSQPHSPFSFLAFGGRNVQKRIEVLLEAGSILSAQHIPFQVLITKGTETESVSNDYFGENMPDWCKLINQNDNVNILFAQADCFISTAIHETFCNAICEATVYGLPVIQSDIDGTMWNAKNPSVSLYSTLDSQALAREMLKMMQRDRKQLIADCLTTRSINSSKYSFDIWCSKVIDFYQKLK